MLRGSRKSFIIAKCSLYWRYVNIVCYIEGAALIVGYNGGVGYKWLCSIEV